MRWFSSSFSPRHYEPHYATPLFSHYFHYVHYITIIYYDMRERWKSCATLWERGRSARGLLILKYWAIERHILRHYQTILMPPMICVRWKDVIFYFITNIYQVITITIITIIITTYHHFTSLSYFIIRMRQCHRHDRYHHHHHYLEYLPLLYNIIYHLSILRHARILERDYYIRPLPYHCYRYHCARIFILLRHLLRHYQYHVITFEPRHDYIYMALYISHIEYATFIYEYLSYLYI